MVPTKEVHDQAVKSMTAKSKKVVYHLKEVAFNDLILSLVDKSATGKIAFHLIKNFKTEHYPKGNCHVTWIHLID